MAAAGAGVGMRGRKAFLSGLLTNLPTPKRVAFTIAFLPQFAIPGVILIAPEFIVDGTVGVLAGRIGGWLRRHQKAHRRVDTATGVVFIGLVYGWLWRNDPDQGPENAAYARGRPLTRSADAQGARIHGTGPTGHTCEGLRTDPRLESFLVRSR